MKKVYFPQHGGKTTEQNLVQDLVDEQIKLFGTDCFYVPRTMLRDKTLGEVIYSEFNQSYMIEMLLINVEGFGSPVDFVSKFGVRISDEIQFVMSRRRWEQSLVPALNLTISQRPNEGDLIYYPLTGNAYEIKFVEREVPFYPLGDLYFYTLTAEIYEQGDDEFDTGIAEIDAIELDHSVMTTLNLSNLQSTATATSTIDQGSVNNIVIGAGGSGYMTAPNITISQPPDVAGGDIPATATATIYNGVVNAITITNAGSGYTTAPTVTIDGPQTAKDFVAREHVVAGNYNDQGGNRSWTSDGTGKIYVDHSGSFDPVFATTTLVKYFYWYFEDERLRYRYTYNGTTETTTKGHFYYDAANNRYCINAYTNTDTSGQRARMYDLATDSIGEVGGWNGSNLTLELMNKSGDFRDGDLINGTVSGALYTLGSFSSIDNSNSEYDANKAIEDGADDIIDFSEKNPFGEFGNFTGSF